MKAPPKRAMLDLHVSSGSPENRCTRRGSYNRNVMPRRLCFRNFPETMKAGYGRGGEIAPGHQEGSRPERADFHIGSWGSTRPRNFRRRGSSQEGRVPPERAKNGAIARLPQMKMGEPPGLAGAPKPMRRHSHLSISLSKSNGGREECADRNCRRLWDFDIFSR